MTVKLVLLKSGEDIIADVTEMIVGENEDNERRASAVNAIPNNNMNEMQLRKVPFGTVNPRTLQKRERDKPGYLKKLVLAIEPVMNKKFTGKKRVVIKNLLLDPAYQVK